MAALPESPSSTLKRRFASGERRAVTASRPWRNRMRTSADVYEYSFPDVHKGIWNRCVSLWQQPASTQPTRA